MRTKPQNVHTGELARLLEKEYGLTVSTLYFLPEGEDSFAFVAEDADGARHFLRLEEDVGQQSQLENTYGVGETLARGKLPALVVPHRARHGRFVGAYGPYLAALFPFIEGRSLQRAEAPEDREGVAVMVAALHESATDGLPLPRAGLENPFEDPIRRALSRAESSMPNANRYQEQVSTLLRAHRKDIESSLGRMETFHEEQDALVGEWVLTHGEPHLANVLKDPQGRLHLTDCGDLAVGPPERDLFAFTGTGFEGSLTHYVRRRGSVRLSPRLFEFYSYRWALQEIADYTTRILFRQMGPEEDEHSWTELEDYLPTRHGDIARGVREVEEVLARLPR